MKLYIVDAFAKEIFGGNPAGVVCIPQGVDFPTEEIMQKTAAELRYSETVFIKQLSRNEFHLRYFTPTSEVDLCGHATIGAFHSIANSGLLGDQKNPILLAHTKAGDIRIYIKEDSVLMDMAEPKHIATINDVLELDRLYDIMGAEFDQSLGLFPMVISTGLPDIIMPVSNQKELDSLKPDFDALSKLSKAYGVTGVHAFTLDAEENEGLGFPSEEITCHARNFAPLYGIDEEAATGTANGALTYYLCLNQKIGTQAGCRIIQGEAMGRPSEILTTIDAGETCTIRVGGNAVILAEGKINL